MNHQQPLRKVQVDLDELCAAIDVASFEHRYFLDTETGEVILVSDMSDEDEVQQQLAKIDAADRGRYLEVPRAESHEGYGDMEDFVATLRDERLQELLEVAIQGRGAFRRFKDVLDLRASGCVAFKNVCQPIGQHDDPAETLRVERTKSAHRGTPSQLLVKRQSPAIG
jgi:uncharacterized protein UPF0158